MEKRVILGIIDKAGYSAEQVQTEVTLADLLAAVENAIEDFGEDALVVLANGQRYGAGYGRIDSSWGEVEFEDADFENED